MAEAQAQAEAPEPGLTGDQVAGTGSASAEGLKAFARARAYQRELFQAACRRNVRPSHLLASKFGLDGTTHRVCPCSHSKAMSAFAAVTQASGLTLGEHLGAPRPLQQP